jgi:hypothetical protein
MLLTSTLAASAHASVLLVAPFIALLLAPPTILPKALRIAPRGDALPAMRRLKREFVIMTGDDAPQSQPAKV